MQCFYVQIGECAEFSKKVTEKDIACFAEVSGDFDPIHMDEIYAAQSPLGRRIAHGVFAMALLSAASAKISRLARERGDLGVSLSLGYDRVRFLVPVFIGDTLTARYTVKALEPDRKRPAIPGSPAPSV